MSYDAVKEKISLKKKELMRIRRRIEEVNRDIEQHQRTISDIKGKYTKNIEIERDASLKSKIEEATRELRYRQAEEESKDRRLEEEHQRKLASCTEESVRQELYGDSSVDIVNETLAGVKEAISQGIGERFSDEYLNQLSELEIEMDEESVQDFLDNTDKVTERVEKLSKKNSFDFKEQINKLLDLKIARDNPKGMLAYLGALLVIMFFIANVIFPFYVVALSAIIVINVKRNSFYARTLIEYKAAQVSIDVIEKGRLIEVKKELARRLKDINAEYNAEKEKISGILSDIRMQINSTERSVRSSFVFDTSKLDKSYNAALSSASSTLELSKDELENLKSEQAAINDDISELEKELLQTIKDIKTQYLDFTKIGTDTVLDPVFLLDVVDNKPLMFEHPQTACIFIYEDTPDVESFIRLVCAQLRVRMMASSLKIRIWDIINMGIAYSPFYKRRPELFDVLVREEDMRDNVKELSELLTKRIDFISREYPTIREYNEAMLEIDSLTESYVFLFVINPPDFILDDDKFIQLLKIGPSVGIFINIFVKKSELEKTYERVIDTVGYSYLINNGTIYQKARRYVLDELVQFKK